MNADLVMRGCGDWFIRRPARMTIASVRQILLQIAQRQSNPLRKGQTDGRRTMEKGQDGPPCHTVPALATMASGGTRRCQVHFLGSEARSRCLFDFTREMVWDVTHVVSSCHAIGPKGKMPGVWGQSLQEIEDRRSQKVLVESWGAAHNEPAMVSKDIRRRFVVAWHGHLARDVEFMGGTPMLRGTANGAGNE